MSTPTPQARKPRSDVLRNRAVILDAAQSHFLSYGIGASLDAIAKEAGVGPGTLYRHFPTREALLAAVLQTRSEEFAARDANISEVNDPGEALGQWMGALEEYLSAFSGLPEPLMAAARESEPDNPLTVPCHLLIASTDEYLQKAQAAGQARNNLSGKDLFHAAVSIAWLKGAGALDNSALTAIRTIMETGYKPSAA